MDNDKFRAALWSRLFFCISKIKNHGTDTKSREMGNVHRNALLESFRNKVHKNDANSRCDPVDFVL
ncbi:hypothetical protein P364_0121595 [Paenibacillus sp. MAEPY2]|nr:hypothetical protein P364_0121595 [Paenibacillus sp. MAEPY2]KGP89479.1 hypothetical protein P363_0100695 [Paenibacillus sp. MAEPY1]